MKTLCSILIHAEIKMLYKSNICSIKLLFAFIKIIIRMWMFLRSYTTKSSNFKYRYFFFTYKISYRKDYCYIMLTFP